jgi:hypothetical protein
MRRWHTPAMRALALGLLSLALGCGSGSSGTGRPDAGPGDTGVPPMDTGTPPVDTGTPPVDAGTDTGPPPDTTVRFVAMGDTGEGNEDQYMVAAAIKNVCDAQGCDFVILLGDNFYDSGVDSVSDSQWDTKFEDPYAELDLPFFAVLGNHDYGGTLAFTETGGLGNEFDKGPVEVAYTDSTESSGKWTMPDTFYTFTWGNVGFIMMDTNSILWNDTSNGDQRAWWTTAMMEVSGVDWVIGAGHHPYVSNGRHGNAGSYESIEVGGVELPNPLPILNGNQVKSFFDDVVCGNVDLYFAGHDHNLQWLNEPDALCGAELIVSGAGAKTTGFESSGNATHFENDATEGFMYMVVDGGTLTGTFYDKAGAMLFERTITR